MVNRTFESSPRILARVAALTYLAVIVAGIIAEMFISARIIVPGDAAATAAQIGANSPLYQLGLSVYLVEMLFQVAMSVPFYFLFRPVSKSAALLMVFFNLIGCAIKIGSRVFYIAPLFVLADANLASAFSTDQIQTLALILLRVNEQAAGISLVFFGASTIAKGYLIIRSKFLPRILGILSVIAGLGWLTFMFPPLASALFLYILALGIIGSLSQIAWLLVKAVNVEQWKRFAVDAA